MNLSRKSIYCATLIKDQSKQGDSSMNAPLHIAAYKKGFHDRYFGKLYDSSSGWRHGSGAAYDAGWNAAGSSMRLSTAQLPPTSR
jgi:hypothetical protein